MSGQGPFLKKSRAYGPTYAPHTHLRPPYLNDIEVRLPLPHRSHTLHTLVANSCIKIREFKYIWPRLCSFDLAVTLCKFNVQRGPKTRAEAGQAKHRNRFLCLVLKKIGKSWVHQTTSCTKIKPQCTTMCNNTRQYATIHNMLIINRLQIWKTCFLCYINCSPDGHKGEQVISSDLERILPWGMNLILLDCARKSPCR